MTDFFSWWCTSLTRSDKSPPYIVGICDWSSFCQKFKPALPSTCNLLFCSMFYKYFLVSSCSSFYTSSRFPQGGCTKEHGAYAIFMRRRNASPSTSAPRSTSMIAPPLAPSCIEGEEISRDHADLRSSKKKDVDGGTTYWRQAIY